ncbi:MAG: hypothetical protein KAI17_14440 [Thiotrichaceae bacterium]|nr:hypothetical protein [Thiotrichaceae bacterium]
MHKTQVASLSKNRLILGGTVFIGGFFSPLLIPLVVASELSGAWKSLLSAILLVGLPEILMLVSVAILGADGYRFLKEKLWALLKKTAPSATVSRPRYILGLVLFILPLIYAWLEPYIGELNPWLQNNHMIFNVIGDFMFVSSFYILGGDFWDKLRALFQYKPKLNFLSKRK